MRIKFPRSLALVAALLLALLTSPLFAGSAAYKARAVQLGGDTVFMFDDASGHPQDTSGNAHNCTASANLTYGATGPFTGSPNRAITAGASPSATLPTSVTLPGDGGGNVACPVTVVVWAKVPAGATSHGLINLTPTGAGTDRFAMQVVHSDDTLFVDHWDGNDTTNGRISYSYTGKRGAWHFIAAKSSGISGSPKALIVDDTAVVTSANSDAPDTALAGGTLFTTPTGNAAGASYAGLAIFKSYVTDADIASLKAAALAPVATGYTVAVSSPAVVGAPVTVTVTATPAGAYFDGSVAITLTPSATTGGSAVVITPAGAATGTGTYTPATAGAATLTGTNNGGWSNENEDFTVLSAPAGSVELLGTTFGSAAAASDTFANCFDGDFSTFFNSASANGYVGRDLGVAAIVNRVRVAPRPSLNDGAAYDNGGQFFTIDGSNAGQNSSLVVLSTKNPADPYAPRNQLTDYSISTATAYRYVRLTSLAANVNEAELHFDGLWAAGCLSRPLPPTFGTHNGGRYPGGSTTVTLSSLTTTASFYYTTNGTTPTTSSTLYTGPFTMTATAGGAVVKAIAYDPACSTTTSEVATSAPFYNAIAWPAGNEYDVSRGILLEAHAGGILSWGGRYYRYGFSMNRTDSGDNVVGSAVNCYSSADGINWRWESQVTGMIGDATQAERPHARYNPATGQFVLWVHFYGGTMPADRAWCFTAAGPTGPWALTTSAANPSGVGYQDGYFFAASNGTAYLVHAPTARSGMHITKLNAAWTDVTATGVRLGLGTLDVESPVMFEPSPGVFQLATGTGNFYDRNSTYAVRSMRGLGADPVVATWASFRGNSVYAVEPTLGTGYNVQPTDIFRDAKGDWVFVGDYWTGDSVMYDSRQTFSPVTNTTDPTIRIGLSAWPGAPLGRATGRLNIGLGLGLFVSMN